MTSENKQFVDTREILELPMITLRGLREFPGTVRYFDIGREKSIKAIEEAMIMYQYIFIVSQNDEEDGLLAAEDFSNIGTIGRIKKMQNLNGDSIRVLVEGLCLGEIEEVISEEPYYKCMVRKKEVPIDEFDSAVAAATGALGTTGALGATGAFETTGALNETGAFETTGALDETGAFETTEALDETGAFETTGALDETGAFETTGALGTNSMLGLTAEPSVADFSEDELADIEVELPEDFEESDDYLSQFDEDDDAGAGEISLTAALEAEMEGETEGFAAEDMDAFPGEDPNAFEEERESLDGFVGGAAGGLAASGFDNYGETNYDSYEQAASDDRQGRQEIKPKKGFKDKLKSMKKRNIAVIAVAVLLAAGGLAVIGSQVTDADAEDQEAHSSDKETVSIVDEGTSSSATTATTTTSGTTKSQHKHKWVAVYSTGTIKVPHTTKVSKSICVDCGADVTGFETEHALDEMEAGNSGDIKVESKDVTTYTTEKYKYISGYKCSCGAKK